MRRTKQEAEETRQTILATAERLFLERGVAEISLQEVAEAAGFSRGAVHWHFQNKQGLLLDLLDRRGLPLQQLARNLEVDDALDPIEALIGEAARLFGELEKDPKQRRLAVDMMNFIVAEVPERHRQFHSDLTRAMRSIFLSAQRRGRLAPRWTPDLAALAFHAMVSGFVDDWLRGGTEFDLSTDAIMALRAFADSLSR